MPPAPCENTAMELDSLEIDWDWDFDLFLEDLKSQPTFCSIGAFDSRNDLLDLLLHFALDETSPGKEESVRFCSVAAVDTCCDFNCRGFLCSFVLHPPASEHSQPPF